jgi:hypothetical protein
MTEAYVRQNADKTADRFVYGAERDVFEKGKSQSHVKKTLRQQAQLYTGSFYACVSKDDDGRIHSTLSTVHGYLLGECVRAYLHEQRMATENVIWCEEIGDKSGDCLLVIIVNGSVEHDSRIPPSTLDRRASLILDQAKSNFTVIVHGDTPFTAPESTLDSMGNIHIAPELVEMFTTLETPIIPQVATLSRFKLVSITRTFDQAKLTPLWLKWVWAPIVIGVIGYVSTTDVKTQSAGALANSIITIDPFREYKTLIKSPAPSLQLIQVQDYLNHLQTLSGAVVQQTVLESDRMTVHLHPVADVVMVLTNTLKELGWATSLDQGNIVISRQLGTPLRAEPQVIMPLQNVLESLLDSAFLAGLNLDMGPVQASGRYQVTHVTVSFPTQSVALYEFISIMLDGMPVVITRLDIKHYSITQQENTLSFAVYGAPNA